MPSFLDRDGLDMYTKKLKAYIAEQQFEASGSSSVLEPVTLHSNDWVRTDGIAPFGFSISFTIESIIRNTSCISITDMNCVVQASLGIVLNSINGQTITMYSLVKPETDVTFNILVEN